MSDIDQILNGGLDLYQFLETDPKDSFAAIRRQYRKKALIFHPDKSGDAQKFNLLNTIYNILSLETLRSQYDDIRSLKLQKTIEREKLDELTKKFQLELLKSEGTFKDAAPSKRKFNLEQLREDGLKRRRLHEQKFVVNTNRAYISYKDLPCPDIIAITPDSESHKVKVKWKYKQELDGQFQQDILQMIMEIFGKIRHIEVLPHKPGDRYDTGIVEYELVDGLKAACNHDFNKSASLWDGTPVRKLASLMRECQEINKSTEIIEEIIRKYNENRQ